MLYYLVCEFRGRCYRFKETSRVLLGRIEGFERNFGAFLPVADFEFRSMLVKGYSVAKIVAMLVGDLLNGS